MSKETKFVGEIEEFCKAFQGYKDKKLVIYGTGRMTATLLENIQGYNIVGLCDRDDALIGKTVYGVPVLSRAQAEACADILIVNTDATYWNTIYKRIQDWKLPIYYRNGERASLVVNRYQDNAYWELRQEDVFGQAEAYDIITFDVFDTLIMRKVMSPYDVFRIVELQMNQRWEGLDFCSVRKKALTSLTEPTLDEIYESVKEKSDWTEEQIDFAKRCEVETERKLIVARKVMCELCCTLMQKKEVYFVSDMYLSKEVIGDLLRQAGIEAKQEQIIVSCEIRQSKSSGALWQWFREKIAGDKKVLHFGDNKKSDVSMPLRYGFQSQYIMDAAEMLNNSSLADIVPQIISLQSSLAMGAICAQIFNNPFVLCETKGRVKFQQEQEAGYVLLGNSMYNFMLWLNANIKEDGVEEILFLGRDGYFLKRLYDHVIERMAVENPVKGTYFETSRKAIMAATVENRADLEEYAKFPFAGSAREYMEERFQIETEGLPVGEYSVDELIATYENIMLRNLREEAENYKCYARKLQLPNRLAVVDEGFYGSIQYYLAKLLDRQVAGYYFCAYLEENSRYFKGSNAKGCFQETNDKLARNSAARRNGRFLEAFLTASNGMLLRFDKQGNPLYAESMRNQQYFNVRYDMLEGIYEFIDEMFVLYQSFEVNELQTDVIFADKLFGCLMEEGFEPTERMKESFWFDSRIMNNKEVPIWE